MNRAEISQSVLDIKAFFARHGASKLLGSAASTSDIQRLEKTIDNQLPFALNVLLSEVNGGMYFMERKQYSTEDIKDKVGDLEGSKKWKSGLIPFCGDDSTLLVIDTTSDDAVFEYDLDDGLGDKVAPNFVRFLETYRNDLLGGHFEYLEDCGVIEKMGKGRK